MVTLQNPKELIATGRVAWAIVAGAVAVTLTFAFVWRSQGHARLPQKRVANKAAPRVETHEEFATSSSCRSCHPEHHASWHDSYHRTMTQVATPEAVVAPFDGIELQDDALTCRLEQRGDEFWATVFATNWKEQYLKAGLDPAMAVQSGNSPFVSRRIELTTGSHHMQVYWLANGTRLLELPFYYHIDGKRWIPRDDSVLAPPQPPNAEVVSSEWRMDCIKCHSLGGKPGFNFRTQRLSTSVAEFGISCEACHGPARDHIRHHRNPVNRYRQHLTGAADPTIINPARLSHQESTQICGQCHISFDPKNTTDFLTHGMRYRAGDKLEVTHDIEEFLPGQNKQGGARTFWKDGTCCVGGDEYLAHVKSGCYLRGTMSCLSCHSMHSSDPDDQLSAGMRGNQACLQCHSEYGDRIEEHTHHPVDSPGSECYNCHMPHTTYALYTAMRSHRVDSPSVEVSARTGRPNACNLCHLDQTLEWTADQLTEWYGAPTVDLEEDERRIAASLLWLLRGDAAQRVITAWHMGWSSAHETSGGNWQAPFVAQLLEDPYSVVRYVAHQSLQNLRGFGDLEYDYIGDSAARAASRQQVMQQWVSELMQQSNPSARVLLESDGTVMEVDVRRLLKQRDNSPVVISE